MYFCKYTSLITGGSSTHKKHRPVAARASADLYRDSCSFPTSYDAQPPLKSYDLNFKPKWSSARPMCANGARPMS